MIRMRGMMFMRMMIIMGGWEVRVDDRLLTWSWEYTCSYSLKLPLLPHNEFENQLELFHEDHIIDNDLIDEDYRDADDVTTENSDLSLQSNLEQNDELEEMMYEQVICEENLYENEFYDDFPV